VSDYLDSVRDQLSELTSQGAHRRLGARAGADGIITANLVPRDKRGRDAGGDGRGPRRGTLGGNGRGPRRGTLGGNGRGPHRGRFGELAAVAAVLAIALAVAVIAFGVGSAPRHAPPSRRTHPAAHHAFPLHAHPRPSRPAASSTAHPAPFTAPAGGPVPGGFSPESFTAISEQTWWLLGSAPCSRAPCTSIVRTEDGGRNFLGIPAPRTSQVDQLRFAGPSDGFAYGPQLWTTHDGGASWAPVHLGGQVADLEASGAYVYAIVHPAGGPGRLERSPIGSDRWSVLPAAGNAYGGLWVQGAEVLLESASNTSQRLIVSHDGGRSFTSHPVPPAVACSFQAPQPPVVWEDCATGMLSGRWISADGGAGYRAAGGSAPSQLPALPNSAAFAAASATTAVTGLKRLYRTEDAGRTWQPVRGAPTLDWSYLGFTDPTHGVAIGTPQGYSRAQLYYTTDGGVSWRLIPVG
jgi:photosystem II stability/assembly factor-like uncharacterized protein